MRFGEISGLAGKPDHFSIGRILKSIEYQVICHKSID